MTLLSIEKLTLTSKHSPLLNSISLSILQGEFVALIGESGSGKTMLARSIISLLPSPTLKITSGEILFEGKNLLKLPKDTLRTLRGQKMGYIPQFSLSSLNPIMTIGQQLQEALYTSQYQNASQKSLDILHHTGFLHPEHILALYPYQLSGGMRQRILIAMALIHSPSLLIADEATSSLDVSLQAEIIDLLTTTQKNNGLGILFITHDLGLVAQAADKVVIMHKGEIVETGPTEDIFHHPQSPHTKRLIPTRPL